MGNVPTLFYYHVETMGFMEKNKDKPFEDWNSVYLTQLHDIAIGLQGPEQRAEALQMMESFIPWLRNNQSHAMYRHVDTYQRAFEYIKQLPDDIDEELKEKLVEKRWEDY